MVYDSKGHDNRDSFIQYVNFNFKSNMIKKNVMISIPLEVVSEIPKLRVTRFSVSIFSIGPALYQYACYCVRSLRLSSAHPLAMSRPKKAFSLYLCFSGTPAESTCSTTESQLSAKKTPYLLFLSTLHKRMWVPASVATPSSASSTARGSRMCATISSSSSAAFASSSSELTC